MKYVWLILITGVISYVMLSLIFTENDTKSEISVPTPTPTTITVPTVEIDGLTYAYHYFKLDADELISLHPNYDKQQTVKSIVSQSSCHKLSNGGFYNLDNQPIGLVVSYNNQLSAYQQNSLFNGFIAISNNVPHIQTAIPSTSVDHAVQTGPLLIVNGALRRLTLQKDEYRRRLVAATDEKNELYFLAIYNPNTAYGGPLLSRLPTVVSHIFKHESKEVKNAINLDGGAASAFYVKDQVLLQEFNPIGSFFCITKK